MANTLNLGNGNWATKEDSLLAYNSENGNYKPLPFGFTRASSATVVNKAGLIETVGSGEPRIDFSNDAKGALLLEPTRSNLIPYSEDFSFWNKNSSNTNLSSFGISTFKNYTLFETNSLGGNASLSFSSISSVVTFSIYAKKGTAKAIRIRLDASVDANCWVNLESGTEVGSHSGQSLEINSFNNNFYRISFTANVTSLSLIRLYTTEATTTNDEIGNVYIYGAQLEQGSYATSYIPTQGQSGGVTRVADSSSQTPPSGIIGQTEGTMFFEIDFANTSGVAGAWSISSGSSANRITMNTLGFSLTQFTLSIAQNYNSSSTKLASTNVTYSDNHKVAIKYSATTLKLFVDGQLADSVATDGFGNYTKFYLGGNQVGVGGDARKFIQADLYNTALTDQELQALTT